MRTATLNNTLATFLPPGFAVSLAWYWDGWALGYCGKFAELGMSALVIGPLQVHFEWSIF